MNYRTGVKNKIIRLWFYLNRGLSIVNEFKYLIAGILALYYTLHFSNPLWIVVMFFVSIPTLMVIGWTWVHHVAKAIDWFTVEFSTYWNRKAFDLQEEQNRLLGEILLKLKKNEDTL